MRTLESLLAMLAEEVDQLSRASHERSLANARAAATELSRRRVQQEEVELFLAEQDGRADQADRAPRASRRRVTRTA
jgi:hypothetical protein